MALALGNPVERPRLLHLLARPDRVAFLQKLGECRPRALGNRVLKLLGKIGERDVGMDGLHLAQQLIGKAPRAALQRRDPVEHRREQD